MFDTVDASKCKNCKNCVSCNINLKCVNQETPWKNLLIPEQIDSSIDKVKLNCFYTIPLCFSLWFLFIYSFLIIIFLFIVIIKNYQSICRKLV